MYGLVLGWIGLRIQEQEFIMHALRSMRGGEVVVRTYVEQAVEHSKQFKKASLAAEMQRLLSGGGGDDGSVVSSSQLGDDRADGGEHESS